MDDSEYPDWLWECLDDTKGKGGDKSGTEGEGDLFSKSKKQRRLATKRLQKQALLNPESLVPKVPLHQQSIDLPSNEEGTLEGALRAENVRDEVTRGMRKARRKGIKEANYLKGMS
ncbi:MAG: hypothetical protein M1824_004258 [Vezdaea acicularis]|nr:MAG: hypothetical protein M1824_004258 [Vezdaea acicularis]